MLRASTFTELCVPAKECLLRLPESVGMVIGPITTGGFNDIERNKAFLREAIISLEARGESIFNQLLFEDAIARLTDVTVDYDHRILEEFFQPLFDLGRIKKLFAVHGSYSSTGAKWEMKQGEDRGWNIYNLDPQHQLILP